MSTQGSTGARKGGRKCTPPHMPPLLHSLLNPWGLGHSSQSRGMKGTQQQGELQNDWQTGSGVPGRERPVSERDAELRHRRPAVSSLCRYRPPLAVLGARSGASVTYWCPCTTAQGDLPSSPQMP